jgi:SNF2 family DNA or RNA helicase
MLVFHANWFDGSLHLWGTRGSVPSGEGSAVFLTHGELRDQAAEHWDHLLVSSAVNARLTLHLPGRKTVDTLAFSSADAVELLTQTRASTAEVQIAPSVRYWTRAAEVVLELSAQQRFVPALADDGPATLRGIWRPIIDDTRTLRRIEALIASMPPVCRAVGEREPRPSAEGLVDSFLLSTLDAFVRRTLAGDEMTHPLYGPPDESWPLETHWLRSLVTEESAVSGGPETTEALSRKVREWLSRLDTPERGRAYRTCFRLHPPPERAKGAADGSSRRWRLTVHAQSLGNPDVVLDADELSRTQAERLIVLPRMREHPADQVRADLARAAQHVPQLAACAHPAGPLECTLTSDEAYWFIREATPLLEREGFGVWLPAWWAKKGPRLRIQLHLRSLEPPSPTSTRIPLHSLVEFDWRVALGDEEISHEELSRLSAAKAPLVRLRGRWMEVVPQDLRTALDFLEQNQTGTTTLADALQRYLAAEDPQTGLPVSELRSGGWIEGFLNGTGGAALKPVPQPNGFHGELRRYQLTGLSWLSFLAGLGLGACLADDMGLGKTIQFIALLLHERQGGKTPGPTLLVVPMSLVGNWRRELARFGPSLHAMVHHGWERLTGQAFLDEVARHDVVISTYGLAYRDFDHLAAVDWHRVALDEAQNIKNPAAKQSAALRSLRAAHRVALTGTPVENRLSELWSIMDFLNPGYIGSAADFRRRFAIPIERGESEDRAERLRHLIRPFVLRRRKDDPSIVPDLPEKMEMKVFCNLTPEQAALYEAVVNDMLGQIEQSEGIQRRGLILATLVKLKQVCNHPAHFLADGAPLTHRSGKGDRLLEMLEEVLAEGDKALVFTQFRQMGHLLRPLLENALSRRVLFLHGGTPRKERDRLVDCFQKEGADAPIFVLSLKTGGVGLNLTAANHVFHFDRWWNPAVEDQATDRAHRIGQYRQVQVHKFICVGTMEERIDALLERKRSLAENIVGTGEEWLTELSTDALRGLLSLSREAVSEE